MNRKTLPWISVALGTALTASLSCGPSVQPADGGAGGGRSSAASSSQSSSRAVSSAVSSAADGGVEPRTCSTAASDCLSASYCDREAHVCRPCSDLGRLVFGAPSVVGPADTSTKRDVPREDPTSQTLYAVETSQAGYGETVQSVTRTQLGLNKQWGPWLAATVINALVGGNSNPGVLVLKDGASVAPLLALPMLEPKSPVLVVDHIQAQVHTLFAVVEAGSMSGEATALNIPSAVYSNISVATKLSPARLWWLSGSSQEKHLETGIAGNGDNNVVALTSPTCPGKGITVGNPWVTPDGSTLFFDGYCTGSLVRQIFVAKVDDNGQPVGDSNTVDILKGRPNGANWSGPSLSTDLCSILFAQADPVSSPVSYTIQRAYRE